MGYKNPEDYVRYHKDYRERNREKLRLGSIQYRKDRPNCDKEWREAYRTRPDRAIIEKENRKNSYLKNKEIRNRQSREGHYRRKYGITPEEKEQMLVRQNHQCAICNDPVNMTTGHLDHCKKPFQLREILCRGCNPGIGNFKEDPARLEKAIAYLHKHRLSNT